VGGAVSSFFDIRNFTISGGNGNGNSPPTKSSNPKDTD
jgi:hypothetical protein